MTLTAAAASINMNNRLLPITILIITKFYVRFVELPVRYVCNDCECFAFRFVLWMVCWCFHMKNLKLKVIKAVMCVLYDPAHTFGFSFKPIDPIPYAVYTEITFLVRWDTCCYHDFSYWARQNMEKILYRAEYPNHTQTFFCCKIVTQHWELGCAILLLLALMKLHCCYVLCVVRWTILCTVSEFTYVHSLISYKYDREWSSFQPLCVCVHIHSCTRIHRPTIS